MLGYKDLIALLKQPCVNSKKQVIDYLENLTKDQILELVRSLNEELRKMSA